VLDRSTSKQQLILGPFQGKPACQTMCVHYFSSIVSILPILLALSVTSQNPKFRISDLNPAFMSFIPMFSHPLPDSNFPTPKSPSLPPSPFSLSLTIPRSQFARGVCGAAASTQTTQLIDDVEKFPGHIACDSASKSEIVVPIVVGGKVVAIIDVDCVVEGGFDEVDRRWLEKLGELVGKGCDW